MNTSTHPTRQRVRRPADPIDYIGRRLSSLAVVIGVFVAILVASLVETVGLPEPVAIGAGVVAFVTTVLVGDQAGDR